MFWYFGMDGEISENEQIIILHLCGHAVGTAVSYVTTWQSLWFLKTSPCPPVVPCMIEPMQCPVSGLADWQAVLSRPSEDT